MISPRSLLAITVTLSEAVLRDLARLARRRSEPDLDLAERIADGTYPPVTMTDADLALLCEPCSEAIQRVERERAR